MELWLKVGETEAGINDEDQHYSPDVAEDWARLLAEMVLTQRTALLLLLDL